MTGAGVQPFALRIVRGLGSGVLPSGYLAGAYEAYDGDFVTLLDTAGRSCPESSHMDGNQIVGTPHPNREVAKRVP